MNIFFDFELEKQYQGLIQNPQSKALTDEIRNVLQERLNVLKDEINAEEKALIQTDIRPMVYVEVMTGFKVSCQFYSEDLGKRMADSLKGLSEYLDSRLNEANSRLNN